MTTNKPHTPATEDIRLNYAYLGGTVREQEFDRRTESFDRWYAAEFGRTIAAAEHRGAVMVMDALKREASDPSWEGIVQPGRSLQELVDHIEHGIRADQEGDE